MERDFSESQKTIIGNVAMLITVALSVCVILQTSGVTVDYLHTHGVRRFYDCGTGRVGAEISLYFNLPFLLLFGIYGWAVVRACRSTLLPLVRCSVLSALAAYLTGLTFLRLYQWGVF